MSWTAGHITTASTVQWTDGTPFDGYILLAVVPPGSYTAVSQVSSLPRQKLPLLVKVPIKAGVINPQTVVPFTTSYDPPNTKYTAAWYDENDTQIAAAGAAFTLTTDPYTITPPTLTAPV